MKYLNVRPLLYNLNKNTMIPVQIYTILASKLRNRLFCG